MTQAGAATARGRIRRRVAAASVAALVGALAAAALWRAFADEGLPAPDDGGKADREHPIVTAARIVEKDGHRLIRLDAEAMQRAGIRTEVLAAAGPAGAIEAFATVVDLQDLAQKAAALAAADAQTQAASARLAASRVEAGRLQGLFEQDQTVSASQAQAAQAAFRSDEAALAAAMAQAEGERAALRLQWGETLASAVEARGTGARGLVDDLLARRRALLQVVIEAPGRIDAAAGRQGAAAPVAPLRGRLVLDDGRELSLQFVSAAPRPDARLAGRAFLYAAPAHAALAPGATVRALLPAGGGAAAAFAPAPSVVWWQGRAWVFVRRAAGEFERQEADVELAGERPARVAGLAPGAEVVVQGAQVLLSEELRAENFSTDVGGR